MRKAEYAAFKELCSQVDMLLDAGNTGSGIRNIDVLEALLGDVMIVAGGGKAEHIPALITRDKEGV